MEGPPDCQLVEVEGQGQKQKSASVDQSADRALGILKVKCQVSTCTTMVFRTSTTKLLVSRGFGGANGFNACSHSHGCQDFSCSRFAIVSSIT